MFLIHSYTLAYFSLLFAHTQAGISPGNNRPREPQSPSPTSTRVPGRPRPTGTWISPEYTWFFEYPLPISPTKEKKLTWTSDSGAVIDYYEINLESFKQQIYPNLPATDMVGYDGISPGPTFVMQNGREAVVRFTNNGPTNMSVHIHGQYNRAPFDGWAADYATPGQYKDYYYPNTQNARTLWYHDHTEYKTADDAYKGQEGIYIITDSEEDSFGLPSDAYDVPLALAAKVFNPDGSLRFDTSGNTGLWGDIIMVNGQPWPYLNVEPRKYRLRLLDASISRTFYLNFQDDDTGSNLNFTVVASDAGLLSHSVQTDSINVSMGERYEVVIDFAAFIGKNITMRNARGVAEDVDYAATDMVMRFVVGNSVKDDSNNGDVPQTLRDIPPIPTDEPAKDFTFSRDNDTWLINGVGFSDVERRILTRPERGEDEIWTLHNGGGGGTHPVHIHLVDFQVLARTGGRNTVYPYESAGRKDVVWLAAGETVQVVARYAPWNGVYMFHCHNLVHEDHDMLVAFNVTQLAEWGYTNDTIFIDPMEPEFRPKDYNAADYTDDAIKSKIAWLYSTDAYNHGNVAGIYSALDAYSTGGGRSPPTTSTVASATTVTSTMPSNSYPTYSSSRVAPPRRPSTRRHGKGGPPTQSP